MRAMRCCREWSARPQKGKITDQYSASHDISLSLRPVVVLNVEKAHSFIVHIPEFVVFVQV